MIRRIRPAVTMLLAAMLAVSSAKPVQAQPGDAGPTPLALGATMPLRDVAMKNVDNKELTLAQVAGKKGTLVLFICNHCPWVKAWQPRLAEVGNAAMQKGIGVIAINANDPAAYPEDEFDVMVKRAVEVGYKFPYVVDATSEVARAFGASHTPEVFLFDAKGKLAYHGAVDDNAQHPEEVKARHLADAVTAVSTGKRVKNANTKALGCGIKFRAAEAPAAAAGTSGH